MKKLFALAFVAGMVTLAACGEKKAAETTTDSVAATVDSAASVVDSAAATVDSAAAVVDSAAKK
ncbi:hypothetical protein SAMN04515674_103221 [Pseudarcicella hirudinis]|uniref:Lipoprotein n=1 Tax=Pseudarcicella hirudinis TaxID=1079859 RepID=A0A1I5QJU4_9BACT|nr:hypothetical protein [Pseudarcicella hirudinis]SFP46146.1 hypothetical protein SAMN04515674_103221 [Pseudarcicella hirudinis]